MTSTTPHVAAIAHAPARPHQLRFWRAFATTMRPYLAPVSGTSGLVGLAIAAPHTSKSAHTAALAIFSLAYGFGQAATDVFQTDTDAISSPYRPLVRKIVTKRDVLAIALAGLATCGVVLMAINAQIAVLALLGVLGLLTYTPFKRRVWGGPLYNAWIVALLPAMGAMCGGASLATTIASRPVLLAMASSFFSYAVFVVLGYLKDVEADRKTGYDTLPVRYGRPATIAVSAVLGALSLIPSALLVLHPATTMASFACWLAGAAMLIHAHVRMLRVTSDAGAHPSIAMSVRAFVFLRLGETLAQDATLLEQALVITLAFELLLRSRPESTQV